MPIPLAIIAKKLAVSMLTDKKVQKKLLTIIGVILGIIILIIGCFFTIMESLTNANSHIIGMVFRDESFNMPEDISGNLSISIEAIKESIVKLDKAITTANERIAPQSLDNDWIKAVFFSIYFEKEQPSNDLYKPFVNCFITAETVNDVTIEVPLTDKVILIDNLKNNLNLTVTDETVKLAEDIYNKINENKEVQANE